MWPENSVTSLLGIRHPIIQAGMIWASGWKLAAAVSQAGGLGVLGSGSMYPHILDEHLTKLKQATDKPFAVNLPLLYADVAGHQEVIFRHQVKIVITSAGNPATYTQQFKDKGITVIHVAGSRRFAEKAQAAGCDAVIAEGFEAGGHNGREETTTFVLIPLVKSAVDIPVIAAGGIATGKQMLAAMSLGADGVQVGSRFVASEEASSHRNFKEAVVHSREGDTVLTLKELAPVRLLKNKFYADIQAAYQNNATKDDLLNLLGRSRAKKGMFEGDMEEGGLEIGQAAALIDGIKPAADIVAELVGDYQRALRELAR